MAPQPGELLKFRTQGLRVRAGQRVLCVNRPRHPPFMWQRFELKDPERWTILNVSIGNCSLFKQNPGSGGVTAQRLNEDGLLCKDVWLGKHDFSIEAMYVGPDPEGAEFNCDVIGGAP